MSRHRTMTRAVERLQREGFEENIILRDGKLMDSTSKYIYNLEGMTVEKIFRFDGETDPADESIVYALRSSDGRKGIFVESFGAYDCEECEDVKQRFIREIKRYNDESLWT